MVLDYPVDNEAPFIESQDVLAQLLSTLGPVRGRGRRPANPPPIQSDSEDARLREPLPQATCSRPRRCTCGQCPRCRDDARWERIFNEKFADPSYYTARSVRHYSSLSRL
ncbi:MAG TPA: hypothetical protein VMT86_03705 [Bryobacteraceae bacterium]|nr:hypothetical protein [Bryobacteraceae bacterium]